MQGKGTKLITEITGEKIIIKPYGRPPGTYFLAEFTADELVIEREIIQGKLIYAGKIDPKSVKEILEIKNLEKLVEKINTMIDEKIR